MLREVAVDGRLYVYRTKPSLARSNHPSPARNRVPRDALPCEATSGTQDDRGSLEFYRLIIPPTWCRAFRARVDYEGTPDERAVLCTAGSAGVFVWDLDDVNRVDTIPFDPTDHTDINVSRQSWCCTALITVCRTRRRIHLSVFAKPHARVLAAYQEENRVVSRRCIRPVIRRLCRDPRRQRVDMVDTARSTG